MNRSLFFILFLFISIKGFSQSYIFPEPKIYNDSLRKVIVNDSLENIYPVVIHPKFATSTYQSCDWDQNIFLPDHVPCDLLGKQLFHIEDSAGHKLGGGYAWDDFLQGNYVLHHISGYVLAWYTLSKTKISGPVNHYYDVPGKPPSTVATYDKGAPLSELEYLEQKLWNVKKLYSIDGKKLKPGTFKNGTGMLHVYRPNGALLRTLTFAEGLLEGPCIYYYSTGVKMIEGNFSEDKFDGTWKEYAIDGELLQETTYQEGKMKETVKKIE